MVWSFNSGSLCSMDMMNADAFKDWYGYGYQNQPGKSSKPAYSVAASLSQPQPSLA